jgi:hypothetical protein
VSNRAGIAGLSHDLLDSVLAARVCIGLGRPVDARRYLELAFLELVELDDRLPHELHDPLNAPAPAVP